MKTIAQTPGALRLMGVSVLARLPLTMFSIGLLVHARHLTGSFAAAGLVAGANAVALGAGAPVLARVADRRGQTAVLLSSASAAAVFLIVIASLPVGAPLPLLVALAAAIGLASPPMSACIRAILPGLVRDPEAARAAFALDATALELTWISGPPLVLGLGALWSTGGALLAGALLLVGATAAFAAQPASRQWRPADVESRPRSGALRAPGIRTLVIVMLAVGAVFGASEVAITAATTALGSTVAAGPLMALWGGGSLIGGLLAVRLGGGARTSAGLALVLVALAAGHLALSAAAGSILAMALVLLIAGATIAPTNATVFAMADGATPAGTATEAFAWLSTAVAVGSSLGAAVAGAVADGAGPAAAFALAGGAGALAVVVSLVRARTLAAPAPAPVPAAAAAC